MRLGPGDELTGSSRAPFGEFSKVAVIACSNDGVLVDHARAITDAVSALNFVCKETLFAVYEPYFRPSKSLRTVGRKNKRKKCQTSNPSEIEANSLYQQQVREVISTTIDELLRVGREQGLFLSEGQDREDKHDDSLKDLQYSDTTDFVKLVELSNVVIKNTLVVIPPLVISSDDTINDKEIFNRVVQHVADIPSVISVSGKQYILPAHSSFLMSDDSHLESLIEYAQQHQLFDLVVIDPPWYNKSARRGSKYSFMSLWQIKALPVPQLLAPDAFVSLWVTNKPKYIRFAKTELFPHWSVELIAEWHWVKVTKRGELVVDLNSPHKKPYETLLIGRYNPHKDPKTSELQTIPPPENSGSQNRRLRDVGRETLDEPLETGNIEGQERSEIDEDINDHPPVKRVKIDRESEESHLKKLVSSTTSQTSNVDESDCCERGGMPDQKASSVRGDRFLPEALSNRSVVKNDQQCHIMPRVNGSEKKPQDIPYHKVICSVPCRMHSRKPPLNDVLSEFLKPHSMCLEMFARSLTPHWTSWGNEVLKFQNIEFFDRFPC